MFRSSRIFSTAEGHARGQRVAPRQHRLLSGSGLGNSSIHDHDNLPILVAGGAACGMKGGRHIRARPAPLANLHLTLLDRVGVRVDKFGDSSGKIEDLFEPLAL